MTAVHLGEGGPKVELRLEGASVWYAVVGRKGVVLFALEPRL